MGKLVFPETEFEMWLRNGFENERLRGEIDMEKIVELRRRYKAIRAEREKNPGVWDGVPEWADRVRVEYSSSIGKSYPYSGVKTYTRTLPKTKAREIAEKWAGVPGPTPTRPYLADILESAINEALGGEK